MWKSVAGHDVSMKVSADGDDWETDPDFENDISEQEQRWGAKTIEGSGRKEHISVAELRQKVSQEHEKVKERERAQAPKASYGYGGKFGVERDRMDKGAMGHDFVAQVEHHSSQTDAARGFGGKFGVQKDRVDKSAVGFEYKGEVEQHASQKDYSKGFGGKFGVEKEKVDKSALGYDYKGQTEKHQSQKDYSKGFGGRYGVQVDHVDKSAVPFTDMEQSTSAYQRTQPVEALSAGAGKLKARFESMAKASDEGNRRRVEEERARRHAREGKEQQEAQRRQQEERNREEKMAPPPAPDTLPEAELESPEEVQQPTPGSPLEAAGPTAEEEPDYDGQPSLPPRSADFLEQGYTSPVREPEPEGTDEEYEEIGVPPPPPDLDNEYEDLTYGLTAKGLYSYEGEAEDEISFQPDDVITHIEMVDEGWWKGLCHGRFGLFPAVYVELMQ